jgi:dTDP-4-dehydrorhamnose reductase
MLASIAREGRKLAGGNGMGLNEADAILVFGRTGQVALALARLCAYHGRAARFLARDEADLCDPAALRRAVASGPWRAAIVAAAYTAVDRAEDEPSLAEAVNAQAPGIVAEACRARGIPLVHFSTNFVFDGAAPRPYREEDEPNPLSVYGRTKLAGEHAVRTEADAYAILRTGWVFGPGGRNFPGAVVGAARGRSSLNMVADETGDPSPARNIAAAALALADGLAAEGASSSGIYHYSGAPSVSRIDFAAAALAAAARADGGSPPKLEPISSRDYPARAVRPLNGRLDCGKIERRFGIARPDWRLALDETVQHILAAGAAKAPR